ncbi:hypothetical protein MASR2M70_04600 [Bacillota bacterium]
MHQALYRTFRPETFEGLLGQDHIVRILQNQIKNGTVGHAYLFCGTRGTGKTTTARILAKGANCSSPQGNRPCGICDNCLAIRDGVFLDVIEIDAASNNGVENIRELRESVKYAPVTGRFKVYIIDEVHMLSSGAFNALLKTLEEPPEYVMFILATTEPQKLPATILSRCMRLDFRRVPETKLIEGMEQICKSINVKISEDALGIIAANGDGSVRDSLSLLDQCVTGGNGEITREDVLKVLGTKGEEAFIQITDMVDRGEAAEALLFIDRMISEGIEVKQFMKDWIAHYRNLMMIKFVKHPENILNISGENVDRMREQSSKIDMLAINNNILQLANAAADARWSTQPRILLELCAVRLAGAGNSDNRPGAAEASVESVAPKKARETEKPKAADMTATEGKQQELAPAKETTEEGTGLDELWQRVVDEAVAGKGSMRMLKKGCGPVCIEGSCLKLRINSETAKDLIKGNEKLLMELLEKHWGKSVRIECIEDYGSENGGKRNNTEELAEQIGSRFNLDVEITKSRE